MDVLERLKIDYGQVEVSGECIKQARHYIKKHKPDIADQYIKIAENVNKAGSSKEVMYYKALLASLNVIMELI